jgi:hypothetical protein
MYQIYSDGVFPIHDNNFTEYCKPHLRNLPAETAFELQKLRSMLAEENKPPYRQIQEDSLPAHTGPNFTTAGKQLSPPLTLKPR